MATWKCSQCSEGYSESRWCPRGHGPMDEPEIERLRKLLREMVAIVEHGLPVHFTQWDETIAKAKAAGGGK